MQNCNKKEITHLLLDEIQRLHQKLFPIKQQTIESSRHICQKIPLALNSLTFNSGTLEVLKKIQNLRASTKFLFSCILLNQ